MFFTTIRNPIIRQYVVVIAVNLTVFGVGMGLAWSSPMLVKLRDVTQTGLEKPITDEEGSWIVSIGFLVGSLMNFTPALLVDRLGRKYSVLVGIVPKVVGAFLMLFATEVWMLILGRALNGISDMFIFTVVPTYASEIASKEVRGSLNTILQLMCSSGIVIMLSIAPFISYQAVNILYTSVIVAALIPIPFLPETPYFLYLKENTKKSIKLLTLLRGSEAAAKEELNEYSTANTGEKINKLELFRNRIFWKSLGMVIVLLVGAQLLGFHAVAFYLQTILESTETSVSPEIASVIIGVIQLLASVFTSVSSDKFGRKPILSTALIGLMVGMLCLGAFFYVTEGEDIIIGFMNFLPLIALILVVFCFNAGSGALNWTLSAELFDNKGRAVGLSIGLILSGLTTFFVTKYFASVMASIGPVATYSIFSVNCLLLFIFVVIFIPETKGKSYIEIQRNLGANIVTGEEEMRKEID